jgi:hypothetical protein
MSLISEWLGRHVIYDRTIIYGYPGRYYAVLRNTRVIPAIFESKIEGVTCRIEPK